MFRHRKGRLIAAAAALALSSVIAVRVMGTSPLPDPVKLAPMMVSVDTSALAPKLAQTELIAGWRIFDRDTETAYTPSQTARITVSFSEQKTISRLRLFGASSYLFNVYRDNAGVWESVPSLSGKDLTALAASWNTIALESPFSATHLLLEFIPQGNITSGIREVEIWGNEPSGSIEGASYTTLDGIKTPQEALALLSKNASHIIEVSAAPSQITVPDSAVSQNSGFASIFLTQNPAVFKRAYILYDGYNIHRPVSIKKRINDLSWTGGLNIPQPQGSTPEWTSHVEEINPAWLVQGENKIEFRSVSGIAYIRGIKLVIETDSGWNSVSSVSSSAVYDGDPATSYEIRASSTNPSIQINFERTVQPEKIRLHLPGPMNLVAGLQYQTTTGWVDVKPGWQIDLSTMQTGWNEIAVPVSITTDALRLVINTIGLRIKPGIQVGVINEVRVSASPTGPISSTPRIVISYPKDGEYFGRTAYIQGFAAPAADGSGNTAQMNIEGKTSSNTDGAFSLSLTKDETRFYAQPDDEQWDPVVKSEYGGQAGASKTLLLNKNSGISSSPSPNKESRGDAPFADNREKYTDKVAPGQAKNIQYKGVTLDIPAGAVDKETEITIIPLTEADLARLNPGMINVTYPDAGYRFLPHGMKFKLPIKISFGYAKQLFAAGQTDDEVNMYFYDESLLRWIKLKRLKVDPALSVAESETDHFTDIINSTLVVPEHPQALSFNPNSIKDIKAADPSAGYNLIEAPQANNKGTANMSYPIEVPPGRNKLQPNPSVQYNSAGGNGWMGLGWDIPLSAITIDTRWGVPRYDGTNEIETYMLDGEQLDPVAHRGPLKLRIADTKVIKGETVKIFHPRVEGQFREIIRHGTAPNNYWWEVTDKNGTKYFYGGKPGTDNVPNSEATLAQPGSGNVFRWALRETRDTNGNTINYSYSLVTDSGVGNGTSGVAGYQLYLKAIQYTGHGTTAGPYTVLFIRDREIGEARRQDVTIDARGGFKMVTADLLRKIEIYFGGSFQNGTVTGGQPVRSYEFTYNAKPYGDNRPGNAFNKTLLTSVTQYGANGTVFNTHQFTYYDEVRDEDGAYHGFSSVNNWNAGNDDMGKNWLVFDARLSALGGTDGNGHARDTYYGFGPFPRKDISAGRKRGSSKSDNEGLVALVDLNGDNLPDKVFDCRYARNTGGSCAGSRYAYRQNISGPYTNQPTYGDMVPLPTLRAISKEKTQSSERGTEAYFGGNVIDNDADSFMTQSAYFTDVNGDGLTDVVKDGVAYFNHLQDGVPTFGTDSGATPSPIDQGQGVIGTGTLPDFSAYKKKLAEENPLMDALRRWIAPFDGQIQIAGDVHLIDTSAEQQQNEYLTADGVRVAIQHNGAEQWSFDIGPNDYTPHTPAVPALSVQKGDRVYFRAQSRFDGAYDRVAWEPVISYTTVTTGFKDVNNLDPYVYRAKDDFIYGGRPSPQRLPFKGKIRIDGDLRKNGVTTDDISLAIYVLTKAELEAVEDISKIRHYATPVIERSLTWDQTGVIAFTPGVDDISVEEGSYLFILVRVDSNIDLSQIVWTPRAYYVEAYSSGETPTDEHGNPIDTGVPPGSPLQVTDENGNYIIQINPLYDIEFYPANNLTAPQQPWKAPKDGMLLVTPWVSFNQSLTSEVVFTIKRRNALVYKREIGIVNGTIPEPYSYTVLIPVQQDDELFFDFSARDTSLLGKLSESIVTLAYSGDLSWKAFKAGTVTVTPSLAFNFGTPGPSGKLLITARRGSEILGRRIIAVANGVVPDPKSLNFDITVNKDDEIFFDFITRYDELANALTAHTVTVTYDANQLWQSPVSGNVTVSPRLAFDFGGAAPDGQMAFGVKKGDAVLGEITINIVKGAVVYPDPANIVVNAHAGDNLHFYFATHNIHLSYYLTEYGAVVAYGNVVVQTTSAMELIGVPDNFHLEDEVFAGFHSNAVPNAFPRSYRGWGYAGYNGNDSCTQKPALGDTAPCTEPPVNEAKLVVSTNPNDYSGTDPNKVPASRSVFLAAPEAANERWVSEDDLWEVRAVAMTSSRLGSLDYISVPNSADIGTASGSAAPAVPRITKTHQDTHGAGFYVSISDADSDGDALLDFVDLNGDRYPDVVSSRNIAQFTRPTGALSGAQENINLNGIRTTHDDSLSLGPGGTIPDLPGDAKNSNTQKNQKPPAKPGAQSPAFGFTGSLGRTDNEAGSQLIDVNGDGLPDRVTQEGGDIYVRFNLGYGFTNVAERWGSAQMSKGQSLNGSIGATLGISGFSDGVRGFSGGLNLSAALTETKKILVDLNGDGLLDALYNGGDGLMAAFNTGAGYTAPVVWSGKKDLGNGKNVSFSGGGSVVITIGPLCWPTPFCFIIINPAASFSYSMSRSEDSFQDVDGDGYADYLASEHDDTLGVQRNQTGRTNLLKTVTRPLGGKFDIEYVRTGNTYKMPQSQWVMSRVLLTDGRGNAYDNRYAYGTGYQDRYEREFYGFDRVTETHAPGTNIERTVLRTFHNDNYYLKGLVKRSVTMDKQGLNTRVWAMIENTYTLTPVQDKNTIFDHAGFPALTRTDTYFYDGTTSYDGDPASTYGAKKSTYQTFAYDGLGNVTAFFDAGETQTQADDVTAAITYWSSTNDYIIKPDTIIVTNGSTQLRKRTAFYEDTTGNLKTLKLHNTGNTESTWTMTYDGYGNIATITDPVGYVLTYTYDADTHTYVTKIEDNFPKPYFSEASYNPLFGQLAWSKDLNGNYQVNGYDEFGRLVSVHGPYDTDRDGKPMHPASPTIAFEYTAPVFDNPQSEIRNLQSPASAVTHNKAVSINGSEGNLLTTVTFADGMKRIIQTKKEADVDAGSGRTQYGMVISGTVVFDELGRVVKQGQPVFQAGYSTGFNPQSEIRNPTIFAYDPLDRTTSVIAPDGATTTTTYGFGQVNNSGLLYATTTVIDPEGNKVGGANRRGTKHSYKDVDDRIMVVVEFNGGSPITTAYAYDPLGQITQVTDNKDHSTTIEYDLQGHRTAITNPDTGRTEYGYDANGNLTSKLTANYQKGKEITYTYDFNRLVTITYPNSTQVVYEYGNMGEVYNRAGRIKKVSDESGTEERYYGKLGEVTMEEKTVEAHTPVVQKKKFSTEYVFDSFGRMVEMTWPDGEKLTYLYDNGGLLKAAWGEKKGNRYDYIKTLIYDEFGQRRYIAYGNGTVSTYAYDELTRRLDTLVTALPAAQGSRTIQNLKYTYDLVGNVKVLANGIEVPTSTALPAGPVTQNFTYDDLYQITKADGEYSFGPGKQNKYHNDFEYDTIGNFTLKKQEHKIYQPSTTTILPKETNYVLSYVYGSSKPHAVTDAGDKLYSYDAAGNMTGWTHKYNGTRRTIIWNEENRVKEIDDNGSATYFLYDDAGERVVKRGQHGESIYVNRFYAVRNGELGTKHVFAGETRVVSKLVKTPNTNTANSTTTTTTSNITSSTTTTIPGIQGLDNGRGKKLGIIRRLPDGYQVGINPPVEKDEFFYHGDHLGSSNMITDAYGAVYQHLEYFPYGETWIEEGGSYGGNTPGYKFTGKELDPETELYYYGARYYDPVLSRWISADPILGKYLPTGDKDRDQNLPGMGGVFNSVNISLYAYGHQNPVRYKDSDGNDVVLYFSGFHGPWENPYRALGPKELTTGRMAAEIRNYATKNKIQDVAVLAYATGKDMSKNVSDTAKFIKANLDQPDEKVVIYGYSLGGEAAMKLAAQLKSEGINVDLLVIADSYVPKSLLSSKNVATTIVPANVKKAINYYQQQADQKHQGKPFAISPDATTDLTNKKIESTHADVDEATRSEIQSAIKQLIKE